MKYSNISIKYLKNGRFWEDFCLVLYVLSPPTCLVAQLISCPTCLVSYVLSCPACLVSYVLLCLTFFVPCVLLCLMPCVFSCSYLTCLVPYVPSCFISPFPYVPCLVPWVVYVLMSLSVLLSSQKFHHQMEHCRNS